MKSIKALFLIIPFLLIFNHFNVNNIRTLTHNALTLNLKYLITEVDFEEENDIYAVRV